MSARARPSAALRTPDRAAVQALRRAATAAEAAEATADALERLFRPEGCLAAVVEDGRWHQAVRGDMAPPGEPNDGPPAIPARGRRATVRQCLRIELDGEAAAPGWLAVRLPSGSADAPELGAALERMAGLLEAALGRIAAGRRLAAVDRDRELAVREIRHRLRNSLQQVIGLVPLLVEAECPKSELEARIIALLTLHDLFGWTEHPDRIDAADYFGVLVDTLRRGALAGAGWLSLACDTPDGTCIGMDRATPLGLIVNELVNNSLKHSPGRPLRLALSAARLGDALVVEYAEDWTAPASVAERAPAYGAVGAAAAGGQGRALIDALLERAGGRRLDVGGHPAALKATFPLSPEVTENRISGYTGL